MDNVSISPYLPGIKKVTILYRRDNSIEVYLVENCCWNIDGSIFTMVKNKEDFYNNIELNFTPHKYDILNIELATDDDINNDDYIKYY